MGTSRLGRVVGKFRNVGPGAFVAAAVVGPGTVTTASVAGAGFGFSLIWAFIFAVLISVCLLEMASRLGVVARMSLGAALQQQFSHPVLKYGLIAFAVLAIGIGNISSMVGNLTGSAIGIEITTGIPLRGGVILTGVASALVLWFGSYKVLEKLLIAVIVVLTVSFVVTAVVIHPDIRRILLGVFPTLPNGSITLVIGMIGTTVIPYTLFLHSSTVQERWSSKEALGETRFDVVTSLVVVGVISVAILVTAATAFPLGDTSISGEQMPSQLEPLLGSWAKLVFGAGIVAAGFSSGVAAPLAAAYALSGLFGWGLDRKRLKFRMVWLVVLVAGGAPPSLGYDPIELIVSAKYLVGLMIPLIVVVLLFVMNNRRYLGAAVNKPWLNVVAVIIFAFTCLLAVESFGLIG